MIGGLATHVALHPLFSSDLCLTFWPNHMLKKYIIEPIESFVAEEDGTTAVEYAVMMALILLALIGGVFALSFATRDSFNESSDAIAGAFAN